MSNSLLGLLLWSARGWVLTRSCNMSVSRSKVMDCPLGLIPISLYSLRSLLSPRPAVPPLSNLSPLVCCSGFEVWLHVGFHPAAQRKEPQLSWGTRYHQSTRAWLCLLDEKTPKGSDPVSISADLVRHCQNRGCVCLAG